MGIYKQGFDYKYSLDEDLLILKTERGQYKFKIENNEVLENIHDIASLLIKELQRVEAKKATRRDNLNHYDKLLLATLNISEKYTKLEKKYKEVRSVLEELQSLKSKLQHGTTSHTTTRSSVANKIGLEGVSGYRPERRETTVPPPAKTTSSQARATLSSFPAQPGDEGLSSAPPSAGYSVNQRIDKQRANYLQPVTDDEKPVRAVVAEAEVSIPDTASHHSEIRKSSVCTVPIANGNDAVQQDSTGNVLAAVASSTAVAVTKSTVEISIAPAGSIDSADNSVIAHSAESMAEPESMVRDIARLDSEYDEEYLSGEHMEIVPSQGWSSPLEWSPDTGSKLEDTILHRGDLLPEAHQETVISPSPKADTPVEQVGYYIGHDVESAGYPGRQHGQTTQSSEYQLPLLSFLKNTSQENLVDQERIRTDAELLETKLGYFGIKGEVMGIHPGPVITTYEYKPDPGIKISKIVNLADDLALALSAYSIRIVAPIPGKDVLGIEIPNIKKSLVPFIDIVTSADFQKIASKIPICLGKDIIGNPVVVELDSMPHLLIAGATGTGKSVGLNAMITSILYKATPDEVRFIMVDPKRIELSFYNDIPHLLTPVITDMNKANTALQWLVREMDRRYNLLAEFQVRHIEQFNQKLAALKTGDYYEYDEELEPLPYIVVIIDELADLMMTASREIEFSLTRLAQMARAAGIHLILATQRPSVDVLTGIIKANFPTRISFQVSSKTDSRTIIDSNGAETLLGNGDMLFVPPGTARLTRVHGTYLSEDELDDITTFIKQQRKPNYIFDVLSEQDPDDVQFSDKQDEYDEKYHEALDFVMTSHQASISGVQRALRVGYNRAARIIDLMEKNGIVGPADGAKPRKVLVNDIYKL